MRAFIGTFMAAGIFLITTAPATAQERKRFVERTPMPHQPAVQTMERAGYPQSIKPHAIPSVTAHDAGGYIGGAKLHGNRIFAKGTGACAPSGPLQDGTYGTDYVGIKQRLGRVFLASSQDPSAGPAIARSYSTVTPPIVDIFNLRPLRNAVLEKREVKEERQHEEK